MECETNIMVPVNMVAREGVAAREGVLVRGLHIYIYIYIFYIYYIIHTRVYAVVLTLDTAVGGGVASLPQIIRPGLNIDIQHMKQFAHDRQISQMWVPLAACHQPAGSYNKLREVRFLKYKTQYLLIQASYTHIVVLWHISNMPP